MQVRGTLRLSYHGTVVLDAVVTARGRDGKGTQAGIAMQPEVVGEGKVEQRLRFTLAEPKDGVVWRNDPDHCSLAPRKEGDVPMPTFAVKDAPCDTVVRPCIVSMAGGLLMLSDKAEVYRDDRNLEGAKRSSPVLFTVPGQLYACAETSRGGCRQWLLEIDRPFDHWTVLARFNRRRTDVPEQKVIFADLGLPDDREHLVFEFWTQTFLGKFTGSFTAPARAGSTGLQVFAIREARPHPWVLSTTRHISQGGVSLLDERWDGASNILSGKSAVVIGDPYSQPPGKRPFHVSHPSGLLPLPIW